MAKTGPVTTESLRRALMKACQLLYPTHSDFYALYAQLRDMREEHPTLKPRPSGWIVRYRDGQFHALHRTKKVASSAAKHIGGKVRPLYEGA